MRLEKVVLVTSHLPTGLSTHAGSTFVDL